MVKSLHADMKARVNFGGTLSEPFSVDNGVKQGDLEAPTIFAIYFAVYAFKDLDEGIYIRILDHRIGFRSYKTEAKF